MKISVEENAENWTTSSLLVGPPLEVFERLNRVLQWVALLVGWMSNFSSVSPHMHDGSHWLLISQRISYSIAVLVVPCVLVLRCAPSYLRVWCCSASGACSATRCKLLLTYSTRYHIVLYSCGPVHLEWPHMWATLFASGKVLQVTQVLLLVMAGPRALLRRFLKGRYISSNNKWMNEWTCWGMWILDWNCSCS